VVSSTAVLASDKSPAGPKKIEAAKAPPGCRIQVLDRALGILSILAESPEGLSPAELGARLSLHKSTIHRLLTVLEHHHLVRRNAARTKYALGIKLFEWGSRAVEDVNVHEQAGPFLQRLVRETSETACLCVLSGTEMLSIANVQGPYTLRTTAAVGRRLPAYCAAVGKAFVAFLPDPALDTLIGQLAFVKRTSNTLVTAAALKAELTRIRAQDYAIDDQEVEEGLRCVGAPLRDYSGRVVASIAIEGPAFRLTDQRLPGLVEVVVKVARDLSGELGYQGKGVTRKERNPHVS
jgi:DNA-binding IclR family transcriptional regulator